MLIYDDLGNIVSDQRVYDDFGVAQNQNIQTDTGQTYSTLAQREDPANRPLTEEQRWVYGDMYQKMVELGLAAGMTPEAVQKMAHDYYGYRKQNLARPSVREEVSPMYYAAQVIEQFGPQYGADPAKLTAQLQTLRSSPAFRQEYQMASAKEQEVAQRDANDSGGFGALGALVGTGIGWATGMPWLGGAMGGLMSTGTPQGALTGGLLGYAGGELLGAGGTAGLDQFAAGSGDALLGNLTPDQISALSQQGGNMDFWDTIKNFTGEGIPLNDAVNTWGQLANDAGSTISTGSGMLNIADIASQIQDSIASGAITAEEGMAAMQAYNNAASGGDWGQFLADQGAGLTQLPGIDFLSKATSQLRSMGIDPSSTAGKTALKNLLGGSSGAGLFGTGANMLAGYLQGNSAKDAAAMQAAATVDAARIAADAAKFRPVGVTTRFGNSQFGYDSQGRLTSAGYNLSPELKAQQDKLMAASGGALDQYIAGQQAALPMGQAGDRAMALGNQYLATDPAAQAQKYMNEQQALLAAGRERDLGLLQNKLQQQGTAGLAMGGTSTGMMAANPQLEAFYNAKRQQDLQLAAQATQGGMDYAKFGAGMVGTGGDLLKGMYSAQSAAYQPYQTALGGAQTLEGLGQNAMTQGMTLGSTATAANAASGSLLAQGMQQSANIMAPANAYSPWAGMLAGAGNYLNQQANPQTQQPQYKYDPYTGQPVVWR